LSVTVEFNKRGYQHCRKPNVVIKEKASIKLNVEFTPEDEGYDSENGEYPMLRVLDAS
jgi:hypothetical protein